MGAGSCAQAPQNRLLAASLLRKRTVRDLLAQSFCLGLELGADRNRFPLEVGTDRRPSNAQAAEARTLVGNTRGVRLDAVLVQTSAGRAETIEVVDVLL